VVKKTNTTMQTTMIALAAIALFAVIVPFLINSGNLIAVILAFLMLVVSVALAVNAMVKVRFDDNEEVSEKEKLDE